MKLYKRLLSLLLACLLCFGLFSVSVFASEESENLVDSNLSNWTDFGEESEYFQSANVSYLDNNVNFIEILSNSTTVLLFDLTQFLKIGDSYRFSFNLPTTNGYNSNSLTSCVLTWALCNGDGDNVPTVGDSVFEININDINKSNYLGKTTTFEFTYTQGYQNTFLCLFVSHGDNVEVYEDLNLYISDVSLQRVTSETENKLDGILGWLEDIKNSITGLGDKLTSVWENITSSVSNLGDRISVFFTDLSNTISTKFNELTTNFSNFITNLGDRISEFFDNLITNVKTFFEELPGKIFNYQVSEDENGNITGGSGSDGEDSNNNLTLFDGWYSNNTKCKIVFYDDYIYFEETQTYADWRYDDIPLKKDYKAVLNFTISNSKYLENSNFYFRCYNDYFDQYFYFKSDGNYSIELPDVPVDTAFDIILGDTAYEFFTVYFNLSDCYITYTPIGDGSSGDTGSDEGSSGSVSWFQFIINKFKNWFSDLKNSIEGFFIKLYEDIKGLFIPSEGYFDDLSNRFDLLIEERFGALVTITDYLVEFFSSFNADVTKEFFDVPIININLMGYNFPIGGWQVRFVPQFNGVEILTNACKFISSVLATFAFFDGLKNKYHEVFGGGD